MSILLIFTILSIVCVFIVFIRYFDVVPYWFLISLCVETLLYVLYHALKHYINISPSARVYMYIILHDLVLISIVLFFHSYVFEAIIVIYYTFFFFVVVTKRSFIEEGERASLPRKTFFEMTSI